MHGYTSNAVEQQLYSEMDNYALAMNIAVVYPEGINNSWNVGTSWDNNNHDDVGFTRVLIDSVAAQFIVDLDRVYACGMSNGGYMAYELACELADKIAAFGSVTGNFMLNSTQFCMNERLIPIIDLHGTGDQTVPYSSSFDGSLTIAQSIEYWRDFNELTIENIESMPDIDLTDNTTVEKFTYSSENHSTQFVHFKVIGGGHQWFGSTIGDFFISQLGLNNHDINTNEELISFFLQYRLSNFIGLLGDVNDDGTINILDIVVTVSLILGGEFNASGDMNADGSLNILDIVILVNLILDG